MLCVHVCVRCVCVCLQSPSIRLQDIGDGCSEEEEEEGVELLCVCVYCVLLWVLAVWSEFNR